MHISELQHTAFLLDPNFDVDDSVFSLRVRGRELDWMMLRSSEGEASLDLAEIGHSLAEIIVSAAEVANHFGIALHSAVENSLKQRGYQPETTDTIDRSASPTEISGGSRAGNPITAPGAGGTEGGDQ